MRLTEVVRTYGNAGELPIVACVGLHAEIQPGRNGRTRSCNRLPRGLSRAPEVSMGLVCGWILCGRGTGCATEVVWA